MKRRSQPVDVNILSDQLLQSFCKKVKSLWLVEIDWPYIHVIEVECSECRKLSILSLNRKFHC